MGVCPIITWWYCTVACFILLKNRAFFVYLSARCFAVKCLAITKMEFENVVQDLGNKLHKSGVLAPWMVPKKDLGDWRACGNYQALNVRTFPIQHPLPDMQDFMASLAGTSVFSKVNVVRAYHHISVVLKYVPNTASQDPKICACHQAQFILESPLSLFENCSRWRFYRYLTLLCI